MSAHNLERIYLKNKAFLFVSQKKKYHTTSNPAVHWFIYKSHRFIVWGTVLPSLISPWQGLHCISPIHLSLTNFLLHSSPSLLYLTLPSGCLIFSAARSDPSENYPSGPFKSDHSSWIIMHSSIRTNKQIIVVRSKWLHATVQTEVETLKRLFTRQNISL